MDLTVIPTYRCSSRCSMCYVWQTPTHPRDEISLETLQKLPSGFDNLNISGGEPTLRRDLREMVDLLAPKARILEISTNGLRADLLAPIISRYPHTKVRFSLEGIGEVNDRIRGEPDGFVEKTRGLRRLRELGGTDLGFAMVIQDDNADQVMALYQFARREGFELSTTALHNGYQFHKSDNFPYDRLRVARHTEQLVVEMLRTWSVKNWFRAYLNVGLMRKILGQKRLYPCTAATDFAFIDPWSDVYACNVRPDLRVGSLLEQTWDEILHSPTMEGMRERVRQCEQNCWMVTSARTAMRSRAFPMLPRFGPFSWVVLQKLRLMTTGRINLSGSVDYDAARRDERETRRPYFFSASYARTLHSGSTQYEPNDQYHNE